MIPSVAAATCGQWAVYQRGLVIDSQLAVRVAYTAGSISKGIGD